MYSTRTRPQVDFGVKMANKHIKELKSSIDLVKSTNETKKELNGTNNSNQNSCKNIEHDKKTEDDEFTKLLEEKLEKMDNVLISLKEQQNSLCSSMQNYLESANKINDISSKILTKDSLEELKNDIKSNIEIKSNQFKQEKITPEVIKKEKKQKKSYYPITDKMWEENILSRYPEIPLEIRNNIYGDGVDFYISSNKKKSKLSDKEVLKILNKKRKENNDKKIKNVL